ncbi:MAG: A/G-specific adenine glycosylase [bacterium]|nr:A/G-specific adenine glycosylase [bacterium]
MPWRKTRDPYKVLVSEVMLQQTQVERVKPFYKKFLRKFPNVKALAGVSLSEVLKSWQGLGYNRRAKLLHYAAKQWNEIPFSSYRTDLVLREKELVPALERLSGVGPYTARAVATFAYNQDCIFIETNIRTAILHHFFQSRTRKGMIYHTFSYTQNQKVSDAEIAKILERALPKGRAREWYSALMDYGAYLKQSGVKLNQKSKHYSKQSKFAGSNREARGAILRELAKGKPCQGVALTCLLGPARRAQMRAALRALLSEHLIQKRGRVFTLPR